MTLNTRIRPDQAEALLATVHGKAEIINGELVLMSPTGFAPGFAGDEIFASLRAYARQKRAGYAIGDNKGFVVDLANRSSFSPDAAYYVGEPGVELGMKFLRGAPLFAAEVRSERDYGRAAELEIAAKRADYFAAGTKIVWDVDLRGVEVIRSYRADSPDAPKVFRRGEIASAEPALPGWSMPVDDLFPYPLDKPDTNNEG